MNWDQIRRLKAMGHTIGSHTVSHPVLSKISLPEQARELRQSRETLERQLGAPVDFIAYPYGRRDASFHAMTMALAQEAGYAGAFSFYGGFNRPGKLDPYDLRRLKIGQNTTKCRFRTKVLSKGRIPV
jgi:peptidoglycan/xylan/chitin deacetylase (PgdA/CDA1 family)